MYSYGKISRLGRLLALFVDLYLSKTSLYRYGTPENLNQSCYAHYINLKCQDKTHLYLLFC